MAQSAYVLSDEGRTFSATNDSGTTAIFAGDIVYTGTINDKFTGTAARVRSAYAVADVLIKGMLWSATGYKNVVGVALEDIPAAKVGAVSTTGLWFHAVSADTEAGDALMGHAGTANRVKVIPAVTSGSTTANAASCDLLKYKIGTAITGGSAAGKFILWKLNI